MNSMPLDLILHLLFPYHGRISFSTGVLLHELHIVTVSTVNSPPFLIKYISAYSISLLCLS